MLQPSDPDCISCQQAREHLLQGIITAFAIIGSLAYIPSVIAAYIADFDDIIIIDTVVYAWVIYLHFFRQHSYLFRAYSLIFLNLVLAFFLLLKLGILGAGILWLFFTPILSTLLISYRQGMALIGVNILLLGLVGYMEFAGLLAASLPENNTSLWLVISVNFILLEIITVASLGRLLDSLETTLFNLQTKQSEIVLTQEATIETVASLAEYRDNETGNHIRRTQNYVRALAVYLSDRPEHRDYLDEETIELLYKSAPLHDIGKVGIPDQILLKPGKLTGEEFEEMKKHAVYGRDALLKSAEKLGNNNFLELAALIAYSHHEKWDGSGYPQGLAGKNIPLAGRIMAVADVYDALISRRVYKQAMSHRQAIQYISENRGTHFDPDIVDAVICLQQQFLDIADRFADSEDERRTLKAE